VAFVVVYDACVLYPAPLRDLLLRLAAADLVRARWTDQILDECFRNILANREDLRPETLLRTRKLMNAAVPNVLVTDFEGLSPGLVLPEAELRKYGVEAQHPDEFVGHLTDLAPGVVVEVVSKQAASLKNPPRTVFELLDTLQGNGLVQTVARLRELFAG
jgi:hypothetical protein